MVNNAAPYKLNNALIGLCASRGRREWSSFSFYQQRDPVSIYSYSPLICKGAIFEESWSQNVVRKKKEKQITKVNISIFARDLNLIDLPM